MNAAESSNSEATNKRVLRSWSKPGPSTSRISEASDEGEDEEDIEQRSKRFHKRLPEKNNAVWTKTEKLQLLEGLKEVGDFDYDGLRGFVKTKSNTQIRHFITAMRMRSIGFVNVNQSTNYLDDWLVRIKKLYIKTDESSFDHVPIAFLLASMFEDLPKPKEACGVDFKALYEYLFCCMLEMPLPKLNDETLEFFDTVIQDVGTQVSSGKDQIESSLSQAHELDKWPFNDPTQNPLHFPVLEIKRGEPESL